MNRRGFTLIEIIVCIALISILGIGSVVISNNYIKKDNLKDITNKILEAANVFVEVEKDKNGKSYITEITKGAKGVQIPLTSLVESGYIKNNEAEKIYDLTNTDKEQNKTYFVMFTNSSTDYCKTNEITATASWMIDEGEVIYLCTDYDDVLNPQEERKEFTIDLLTKNKSIINYEGDNVGFYDLSECANTILDDSGTFSVICGSYPKTKGLHKINIDNKNEYFYRGDVNVPYVLLGLDHTNYTCDNTNIIFTEPVFGTLRILSFNENEITLISNEIPLNKGDYLTKYESLEDILNYMDEKINHFIDPIDFRSFYYNNNEILLPLIPVKNNCTEYDDDNCKSYNLARFITKDELIRIGISMNNSDSITTPLEQNISLEEENNNFKFSSVETNPTVCYGYHCLLPKFPLLYNDSWIINGDNNKVVQYYDKTRNLYKYIVRYIRDGFISLGGVANIYTKKNSSYYTDNGFYDLFSYPVFTIELKKENYKVLYKGSGTKDDPYILYIDSNNSIFQDSINQYKSVSCPS